MKILVADDNPGTLKALSDCVRGQGHQVFEADNGYAARSYLEDEEFDILLTDWDMPGLKGDEVIEWVKTNKPSVKTILISGHPRVKQFAASCKADAYIEKGFSFGPEQILKALEQVTQR